jgi:hypothetical protein
MYLTSVVNRRPMGTPFQLNFQIFLRVYHTTASHQKCDVCTAVKTRGQQNLQHLHSRTAWVYTAKTENSKQIFPEMKLCGLSTNSFIHVSVSDLYIPANNLLITYFLYKTEDDKLSIWFVL